MKIKKRRCKICDSKIKKKNKEAKFCSSKCFKVYIDSDEFDKELNEALNIKND
jgi:endogenous inhibitor of DNA gyrase (YacG/DUF329 family)